MREIKFRVWDEKHGVLYDWDTCFQQFDLADLDRVGLKWMQYTGLKDKNGKEIYEGDLIRDSDSKEIGQVIWCEDELCWTTEFKGNSLWGFVPRNGKDNHCEVIGNIYENPELIKG